ALKICISQGVKRGMYSNEAGMGSTPHAHAVAMVKKPHDQGVAAMIGVFIDTFVVLTLTGLIVVSTLYAGGGPLSIHAVPGAAEGIDKTNMVQIAVGSLTSPQAGNIFVAVCLFFFAFSSIIGWNYFGKINVIYLFGKKAVPLYMLICLVFIFLGSVVGSDLVWELGDMFSQLMIIPNVAALVVLGKAVAKHAKAKK
ncbi:MAG: alanine:cation symporter family protein, partial [Clostridia bacterium]|nr:alanine:cation symporter family protein [Clostridia bacterium]